jgi:thiol:disulfide interchange protein DsbD
LWVYGEQKGLGAMVQVLFSLVLAGFAAWIFGLGRKFVALILFSCALIFGYSRNVAESGVYKDNFGQVWESYSDELVTKYKREGIPMYIDFTASWCITCQVNKTVVFASKTVRDTIREKGIKLIRADWTSEDPLITRALQFYGSEGVPLNVVYNREGEYKILPTLLTPNIVLESIKED